MALLFMDSFAGNDISTKWDAASAIYQHGTTTPRLTGGSWISMGYGNNAIYKTVPASSKIIMGCGMRFGGFISFYGDAGATQHISVIRNTSTGLVEIRRGGTSGTVLATSSNFMPYDWTYIEASVTISDTVGEVHVRINGANTDFVSYTGDTKNAGTATTIDRIAIATQINGNQISDVYILDDTGAANNAFLGDVGVKAMVPNGNGNSSQLVGSDGNSTDNYLLVDDTPFSSADYAGSATTGQKDTYTMSNLPAAATNVYGVQLAGNMVKSDAGVGNARLLLRSGGTDYSGNTEALSTSNATYIKLYEQDPATSAAWTVSNANSAEAGMEVM